MLGSVPCVSSCGPVELLCEEWLGLPEVDMMVSGWFLRAPTVLAAVCGWAQQSCMWCFCESLFKKGQ